MGKDGQQDLWEHKKGSVQSWAEELGRWNPVQLTVVIPKGRKPQGLDKAGL